MASSIYGEVYHDDLVTIYQGDALEVLPELERARLILTDPPYGTGLVYAQEFDDGLRDEEYWTWFDRVLALMRDRAEVVIFTHRNHSMKHIRDWDWVGVWHKPACFGVRIGKSPILPHWEPIYFYGIHGGRVMGTWTSDVFSCMPVKALRGRGVPPSVALERREWQKIDKGAEHPTPKPIDLMEQLILAFTEPGDLVVDPFLGSGTTCMASKKLGRRSIGIDVVPRFCELSARRCSQMVLDFQTPELEGLTVPLLSV